MEDRSHRLTLVAMLWMDHDVSDCGAAIDRVRRIASDLVESLDGQHLEYDLGQIAAFADPTSAARFSMAFHDALLELSVRMRISCGARVAIHTTVDNGERHALSDAAIQGRGLRLLLRIAELAEPRQTLLTAEAWDAVSSFVIYDPDLPAGTQWMKLGAYELHGEQQAVQLFEIGVAGFSPFRRPRDGPLGRRVVSGRGSSRRRATALLVAASGLLALFGLVLWLMNAPEVKGPKREVRAAAEHVLIPASQVVGGDVPVELPPGHALGEESESCGDDASVRDACAAGHPEGGVSQ